MTSPRGQVAEHGGRGVWGQIGTALVVAAVLLYLISKVVPALPHISSFLANLTPKNTVSKEAACMDAMYVTISAPGVLMSDQGGRDAVRSQANALLNERSPDEAVNTAVYAFATKVINLVDAADALASSPDANTGLPGADMEALASLSPQFDAVTAESDRVVAACS